MCNNVLYSLLISLSFLAAKEVFNFETTKHLSSMPMDITVSSNYLASDISKITV